MNRSKVTFLTVRSNQAKLNLLVTKILESLEQEKKILIQAPNEEAAKFIDLFLWNYSEESFIPHKICDAPNEDWVTITTLSENVNQAQRLFNLCPAITPIHNQFEEIFELDDQTDPSKAEKSQKKFEEYRSHGAYVTLVNC